MKVTKGFSEPLYTVFDALNNRPIVVLGASSPLEAIRRAYVVRHLLPDMPDHRVLRADFLESGPVSGAAYVSGKYIDSLEQQADEAASGNQREITESRCPLCGGPV